MMRNKNLLVAIIMIASSVVAGRRGKNYPSSQLPSSNTQQWKRSALLGPPGLPPLLEQDPPILEQQELSGVSSSSEQSSSVQSDRPVKFKSITRALHHSLSLTNLVRCQAYVEECKTGPNIKFENCHSLPNLKELIEMRANNARRLSRDTDVHLIGLSKPNGIKLSLSDDYSFDFYDMSNFANPLLTMRRAKVHLSPSDEGSVEGSYSI